MTQMARGVIPMPTIEIFFAVYLDSNDGRTGKRTFEQWLARMKWSMQREQMLARLILGTSEPEDRVPDHWNDDPSTRLKGKSFAHIPARSRKVAGRSHCAISPKSTGLQMWSFASATSLLGSPKYQRRLLRSSSCPDLSRTSSPCPGWETTRLTSSRTSIGRSSILQTRNLHSRHFASGYVSGTWPRRPR